MDLSTLQKDPRGDDAIKTVSARVSAALSGPNSLGRARRHTANNRIAWAEEVGLTDLGTTDGSCAMILGVPKEAPHVLVKVVPLDDAFVEWAEELMAEPHGSCPHIYSVTHVRDKAVIIQQRIDGEGLDISTPLPSPPASLQTRINLFCSRTGAYDDHHRGNVLVDRAGKHWFIDPVFNQDMAGG